VLGSPIQPWDAVLTRLHARYGKDIKDDLVFKAAPPIVGGREHVLADGKLEERSRPDSMNNFQARYAIRHEWTGPITCAAPKGGRWGGPPPGVAGGGTKAAQDVAFAPRGKTALPELVRQDVPEIDVKMAQAGQGSADEPPAVPTDKPVPPPVTPPAAPKKEKAGCGCATAGDGGEVAGGALLVMATMFGVRRRRRRRV
jgi:MYXO-CTERM domain-containing protein